MTLLYEQQYCCFTILKFECYITGRIPSDRTAFMLCGHIPQILLNAYASVFVNNLGRIAFRLGSHIPQILVNTSESIYMHA